MLHSESIRDYSRRGISRLHRFVCDCFEPHFTTAPYNSSTSVRFQYDEIIRRHQWFIREPEHRPHVDDRNNIAAQVEHAFHTSLSRRR